MRLQSPEDLLWELRGGLDAIYHERLRGLYLFGSSARGEADDESDLDLLVVLDRIDHYGLEIDRTSHLIAELSLTHGVSISRVFASEPDWLGLDTLFLRNVRREARAF